MGYIVQRRYGAEMMRLVRTVMQQRPGWLIVVAVTLAASMAGIFSLPVLDRDEARFAQATAQMLETGDWVRISFLDEDRNKKPVGIHWIQLATVSAGEAISGALENRQIWAWRLASTLGAVLAALGTLALGNRLLGHPAGLYAGVLLGASVLLGIESGIAKTDAMLAGLTIWALYALIRLRTGPPEAAKRWAVALWVLMALGALVKGPVTPMAVALAAIGLALWEQRWNWLRPLAFWPGPVLATLILLPWLISVQIATGGDFLREALGDDLGPKLVTGHESHGGLPGYHILLLNFLFFPAILFLPAGLRAGISAIRSGGEHAAAARMLIVMSIPFWIVFELLPTKLPHYVLPAYPALAIFAAWGVLAWQATPALWRWLGAGLMVAASLLLGAILFLLSHQYNGPVILASVLAVMIIAAAIGAIVLAAGSRTGPAVLCAVLAGLVWQTAGRGIIAPQTNLFPSRDAAALVHAQDWLSPQTVIRSSYTEPSLAFALRSDTDLMDFPALAALSGDFSAEQLLIIDLSRLPQEDEPASVAASFLDALRANACGVREIEGFNYSRGRATSLLIARTGDCAAVRS